MASDVCPIILSDDEEAQPTPAAAASPVHTSRGVGSGGAATPPSSEEYDYTAVENDIDLNDVSLHESDIEEGDVFAENLERYTELQRRTEERLNAEPLPLRSPTPDSPGGAAKRSASETGGRGKRRRLSSPELEEDDEEFLANLLVTPPAAAAPPTTRRARRGRALDMTAAQVEEQKPVVAADSPLPPEEDVNLPVKEPERSEPTLTARVQAGRLIIRLKMKRSERLQRLFDAVAEELSLPPGRVCLGQRDVIYSPHQTPDDVALGPFDMIEFWEGTVSSAAAPAAPEPAETVDPDSLQLKVQSAERRGSVMIRLGRTEAMSALMERYAREKGVALDQLRFRFDGEALDPTDTPETLDLEGGECIDVHSC